MKAIHGGKSKNDRKDAATLSGLLRSGYFPLAYVYPKEKRDTRDLLRRRSVFVRQRAQLITHIQLLNSQYNLPPFEKKLTYKGNRTDAIADRFGHPSTKLSVAANLTLIESYDEQIAALELHLTRSAKKAHAILEAKIGRTVYHLWKKQTPFDARKFLAS